MRTSRSRRQQARIHMNHQFRYNALHQDASQGSMKDSRKVIYADGRMSL